MKRLSLLLLGGIAVVAVAACGGGAPPQPVTPQQNVDSIAQAEKARQDSIDRAAADARAREEAERLRQQRIAGSLAALGKTTEAERTMLATMINFDYHKSDTRAEEGSRRD